MDDDDDVQDLRDLKRLRVEAIRRARVALGAVEFQLRPDGDGNEFAVEKYTDRLEAAAREFLRDIGRHQEAAAESAERPCKPCKHAETPSASRVGSAAATNISKKTKGAAAARKNKGETSAYAQASAPAPAQASAPAPAPAPSSAKRPPIHSRRPGKEPMRFL